MTRNGKGRRRSAAPGVEGLEDRRLMAVALSFDYSLDAYGFFTPDRRALLESTLNAIASRLGDTLAAVPFASYQLDTAAGPRTVQTAVAANTVKIYAYGDSLSDSIAQGGAFYSLPAGNAMRGQGANDFAPDITFLHFDADGGTNWFFGQTTAGLTGSQVDFVTVARHEFLHAMGFLAGQPTFARYLQGGAFTGPNARAAYGTAVPMSGSHVAAQVPSIMNAVTASGVRTEIGGLEWALLRDLGWSVTTQSLDFVRDYDLFAGGRGDGQARVRVDPLRGVHLLRLDVLAGDTLRLRTLDGATAAERGADSFLKIFDANGREVLRNDDSASDGKEDFTHTFATGGRYWVGAGTYDQATYTFTSPSTVLGPAGAFYLEATLTGRAGGEPRNIASATAPVTFSAGTFAAVATLTGEAADYYRIDAVAGGVYGIATSLPAGGGLAGPTVASIYDAAGRRVATMDGSTAYGSVVFTAPATAPYFVRVARAPGPATVPTTETIADPGFRVESADGAATASGARSRGHDYALTIAATLPSPPVNRDPLFVDFGPFGLWRWAEATGFVQINAADPQDFVVGADGSLFVDFGTFGVWRWTEAGGMQPLSGADPEGMAAGPDGSLYVDFGRFGLWRWTGGAGFQILNGADPQDFAAGGPGELFVDFGPFGLWRWTAPGGLQVLNGADPEGMVSDGLGTLFVDFGASGLWLRDAAGGFARMHEANPEGLATAAGGMLLIDFGPAGLWAWRRGAFDRISEADPQGLVGGADGWSYVDFGAYGLWRWAPVGGFQLLNAADPQRLAVRAPRGA